jgi:hypothetical protein
MSDGPEVEMTHPPAAAAAPAGVHTPHQHLAVALADSQAAARTLQQVVAAAAVVAAVV